MKLLGSGSDDVREQVFIQSFGFICYLGVCDVTVMHFLCFKTIKRLCGLWVMLLAILRSAATLFLPMVR